MICGVYYSNWSVYGRKHFPRDLPVAQLTHVFYAFLKVEELGQVVFSDEWADLQLPMGPGAGPEERLDGPVLGAVNELRQAKVHHPHLKLVFSVGGWGTGHTFSAVMASTAKMDRFVASAADLVAKYGFDGIDIDWEYPNSLQEGHLLVRLVRQLRAALDQIRPGLVVCAATPAGDALQYLPLAQLDRYISFYNVMCYDFTGSWSSKAGYHLNLFGANGDNSLNAADTIAKYVDGGASRSKLVLGMPLYGRKFLLDRPISIGLPFQKPQDEGIVDYKNINPLVEIFDPRKVSASGYENKTWVCYDNQQSAKIKAQFVVLQGLGGGFFWDSAGDDPRRSLIAAFAAKVTES